jgi:hypothetical protein
LAINNFEYISKMSSLGIKLVGLQGIVWVGVPEKLNF